MYRMRLNSVTERRHQVDIQYTVAPVTCVAALFPQTICVRISYIGVGHVSIVECDLCRVFASYNSASAIFSLVSWKYILN